MSLFWFSLSLSPSTFMCFKKKRLRTNNGAALLIKALATFHQYEGGSQRLAQRSPPLIVSIQC